MHAHKQVLKLLFWDNLLKELIKHVGIIQTKNVVIFSDRYFKNKTKTTA